MVGLAFRDVPGVTPISKYWEKLNWRLLVSLALPVMLETLDYTVVASAQPHIASIFDAVNLQSFIGTSYLLSSAAFLPFFVSVANVYGRHLALQFSLFFFLAGSVVSTGAINMPMILAGRGIAGIGAAGLLTIVRTIISDSASPDGSNPQQSILYILYAVAFGIGPVVGSVIVNLNFRWVFVINLPTTALAMLLCYFFLRSQVKDKGLVKPLPLPGNRSETWISKILLLDWIGPFIFFAGSLLILLGLNWGPNDHWKTARVIAYLVLGSISIVGYLLWEYVLQRQQTQPNPHHALPSMVFRAYPMLSLELFKSYDFCVVQYHSFVCGVVMFVIFYFLDIFMIIVFALQPSQAGFQLLFYAPGMAAGLFSAPRILKYFNQPKYLLIPGFSLITIGFGLLIMGMQELNNVLIDVAMALTGLGMGLCATPLIVQGRQCQPGQVALNLTTMLFFRCLGGMLGLAQCFTIMNLKVNDYVAAAISNTSALSASDLTMLTQLFASGDLTSLKILGKLPPAVQLVIRSGFNHAIRWSFISILPWSGVAAGLAVFLSRIQIKFEPSVSVTSSVVEELDNAEDNERRVG
ncbi:MFS general substrate transporter [Hygrophoropsis aurantiaca]|uniref:MFS general substrate transporter n=1 Tax=Hygrophoropsis aurantiaca TaxID=72124 RepID=A0ACB8AE81_9AGAM|nr:MFS general substrate transporter [Hygrophoropsis aurantiaca]